MSTQAEAVEPTETDDDQVWYTGHFVIGDKTYNRRFTKKLCLELQKAYSEDSGEEHVSIEIALVETFSRMDNGDVVLRARVGSTSMGQLVWLNFHRVDHFWFVPSQHAPKEAPTDPLVV